MAARLFVTFCRGSKRQVFSGRDLPAGWHAFSFFCEKKENAWQKKESAQGKPQGFPCESFPYRGAAALLFMLRRSAAIPPQLLLGGSTPLFFAQLRRMGSRNGPTGGHRQNHTGHTWPRGVKSNLPAVGKRQTLPLVCFAAPQEHVPGQTCQHEQRADDAVAQQI